MARTQAQNQEHADVNTREQEYESEAELARALADEHPTFRLCPGRIATIRTEDNAFLIQLDGESEAALCHGFGCFTVANNSQKSMLRGYRSARLIFQRFLYTQAVIESGTTFDSFLKPITGNGAHDDFEERL